jgi:uncharacterized protein YoxC
MNQLVFSRFAQVARGAEKFRVARRPGESNDDFLTRATSPLKERRIDLCTLVVEPNVISYSTTYELTESFYTELLRSWDPNTAHIWNVSMWRKYKNDQRITEEAATDALVALFPGLETNNTVELSFFNWISRFSLEHERLISPPKLAPPPAVPMSLLCKKQINDKLDVIRAMKRDLIAREANLTAKNIENDDDFKEWKAEISTKRKEKEKALQKIKDLRDELHLRDVDPTFEAIHAIQKTILQINADMAELAAKIEQGENEVKVIESDIARYEKIIKKNQIEIDKLHDVCVIMESDEKRYVEHVKQNDLCKKEYEDELKRMQTRESYLISTIDEYFSMGRDNIVTQEHDYVLELMRGQLPIPPLPAPPAPPSVAAAVVVTPSAASPSPPPSPPPAASPSPPPAAPPSPPPAASPSPPPVVTPPPSPPPAASPSPPPVVTPTPLELSKRKSGLKPKVPIPSAKETEPTSAPVKPNPIPTNTKANPPTKDKPPPIETHKQSTLLYSPGGNVKNAIPNPKAAPSEANPWAIPLDSTGRTDLGVIRGGADAAFGE